MSIGKFFKRLFCQHVYVWLRNYGPHMAVLTGGVRSSWKCKFCDKVTDRNFYGEAGQTIT